MTTHPIHGKHTVRSRAGGARARRGLLALALLALALPACDLDLQSPDILTYDEVDPNLMVNAAIEDWMTGWNSGIMYEWIGSDEALAAEGARSNWQVADDGDLTQTTYFSGYGIGALLSGREATRIAIQRAEDQLADGTDPGASTALMRAKAYRGWFVTGLARRRGAQPIMPEGPELTQREQYEHALGQFEDVVEMAEEDTDSMRVASLAGIARLQWMLGSDPLDANRLATSIEAAEEALVLAPEFMWALEWPYAYIADYYVRFFGIAVVAPAYENVPMPLNTGVPPGDMFVDFDELWLIIADAHRLRGEMPEARAALKSVPLLKTNHVGLAGRDPEGAPLTQVEVDTWVDGLDATGVADAIDWLYRENIYLRGRRSVSQTGEPILPIPLPPEAL